MGKLLRGLLGLAGAWIGWMLGSPLGEVGSFFLAVVGVAIGFYIANRILLYLLG